MGIHEAMMEALRGGKLEGDWAQSKRRSDPSSPSISVFRDKGFVEDRGQSVRICVLGFRMSLRSPLQSRFLSIV